MELGDITKKIKDGVSGAVHYVGGWFHMKKDQEESVTEGLMGWLTSLLMNKLGSLSQKNGGGLMTFLGPLLKTFGITLPGTETPDAAQNAGNHPPASGTGNTTTTPTQTSGNTAKPGVAAGAALGGLGGGVGPAPVAGGAMGGLGGGNGPVASAGKGGVAPGTVPTVFNTNSANNNGGDAPPSDGAKAPIVGPKAPGVTVTN